MDPGSHGDRDDENWGACKKLIPVFSTSRIILSSPDRAFLLANKSRGFASLKLSLATEVE